MGQRYWPRLINCGDLMRILFFTPYGHLIDVLAGNPIRAACVAGEQLTGIGDSVENPDV